MHRPDAVLPSLLAAAAAFATLVGLGVVAVPAASARSATSTTVQLDQLLASSGSTGWSVRVDENGRELYSSAPARQVPPASTEKLVTAYTALRRLGPSSRFVTTVGRTGAVSGGVLWGRLVLTGGGDPTLTSGGLATLAREVRAAGIRSVTGALIADGSRYAQRCSPHWKAGFVPTEVGPLSALAVDADRFPGASCRTDPALVAGARFKAALAAAGVAVHGPVVTGTSRGSRAVGSVRSQPLSSIVRVMLKQSNAFDAEMLLLALGAQRGLPTLAGGVTALRAQAAALHVRLGAQIWDGSGLAYGDLETADALVAWLEATQRQTPSLAAMVRADLPVACVDGTLAHRDCGTAAAGRVRAKTGTLDISHDLAGYVVDAAGHTLTFAFLLGGPSATASASLKAAVGARAMKAIDRSVQYLAASRL